jgi:hypothetical protein
MIDTSRSVADRQRQVALGETLPQPVELDVHDRPQLLASEPIEDHHLVDPVEELRTEVAAHVDEDALAELVGRQRRVEDVGGPEVGGHDDHHVAEVDGAAVPVGEAAVVEHLQQHVEHVGVRLLDLVEQDDAVGPPAHRLGELSALVVADVARRRADEPGDGVLLLVLAHVEADHRPLVVEQEGGEGPRQLGLADPGGSEEQEGAEGTVGIGDAGPRPPHGVRDRLDGLVLADHAPVELLLEPDELGGLGLDEAADRDAGPAGHDLRDLLLGDLLLEQALALGPQALEPLLGGLELALQLRGTAVAQLGGAGEVTVPLGRGGLLADLLELLLRGLQRADRLLLLLPPRAHPGVALPQVRELRLEVVEACPGRVGLLLLQAHALDLELPDASVDLVDLRRERVDRDAQPRGGLVEQVDRLVGQEPLGQVAVRQRGGRDDRVVGDPDAVVDLVALLEPAQDADRVDHRRLRDVDGLEASLEGGVLLDVAVLGERGRADHPQLPAGEHRLDHVGRVHGALGAAGPDHRVQLVDEGDDAALRRLDLLQHGLEALLELAPVLRPRDHRGQVELDQALVLQQRRDVALDDPAGEPLDDRGLADPGLADQHRVVLGAADEDLDDPSDLLVPADHRVELAVAGELGEVARVLLERFVGRLRILARHALRPADLPEPVEDRIARDPLLGEHAGGPVAGVRERQQQVFGGDVVVAELAGLLRRGLEDARRPPLIVTSPDAP